VAELNQEKMLWNKSRVGVMWNRGAGQAFPPKENAYIVIFDNLTVALLLV
jgi:hypothetical protein